MRSSVLVIAVALALTTISAPVFAKGCLKGAVAGGAAGHFAGHHGVIGAAAGCLIGRHYAHKRARSYQHGTSADRL
jgi:hypothetical protein